MMQINYDPLDYTPIDNNDELVSDTARVHLCVCGGSRFGLWK